MDGFGGGVLNTGLGGLLTAGSENGFATSVGFVGLPKKNN